MKKNDFKKFLEDNSWNYGKKEIEQMMEKELEKEPEDINTELVDACMDYLASYGENTALQKDRVTDDKKLTHKRIKFSKILVAAVIAVILTATATAFAVPTSREYIVARFSNHSEYNVVTDEKAEYVKSFVVGYVPDGFEMTEKYENDLSFTYIYENDDKNLIVKKGHINGSISYDTEKYDDEIIQINGADAIYYKSDDNCNGIIFNNGKYIYMVDGINVGKEEIVKIAQNLD